MSDLFMSDWPDMDEDAEYYDYYSNFLNLDEQAKTADSFVQALFDTPITEEFNFTAAFLETRATPDETKYLRRMLLIRLILYVFGIAVNLLLIFLIAFKPLLTSGPVTSSRQNYRSTTLCLLVIIAVTHIVFLAVVTFLELRWPFVAVGIFCLQDVSFMLFNSGQWLLVVLGFHTVCLMHFPCMFSGSKHFRRWLVFFFYVWLIVAIVQLLLRLFAMPSDEYFCIIPNKEFLFRMEIFGYAIPVGLMIIWLCLVWAKIFCWKCRKAIDETRSNDLKRVACVRIPTAIFFTAVSFLVLPFRLVTIFEMIGVLDYDYMLLNYSSTAFYIGFPFCCLILREVRDIFAACLTSGHKAEEPEHIGTATTVPASTEKF